MNGGNAMTLERFFGQDIDPEKAVQLFNIHHLYYAIFLVITYIVTLKFAAKIKASAKEHTYKTYAFIFLAFLETTYHIHNWSGGIFSIPLHVCGLAVFMNLALLLTDCKKVFNYAFFFGICGGTIALLLPLSKGYTYYNYRYYNFLIIHCTIVAIPLYYYKALGYRVTYRTTLKVYRTSVLSMIVVLFIDRFLVDLGVPIAEANYWFVAFIPANVEGVFTSWSVYVATFMLAVFLSMSLLYLLTCHSYQMKQKTLLKDAINN